MRLAEQAQPHLALLRALGRPTLGLQVRGVGRLGEGKEGRKKKKKKIEEEERKKKKKKKEKRKKREEVKEKGGGGRGG